MRRALVVLAVGCLLGVVASAAPIGAQAPDTSTPTTEPDTTSTTEHVTPGMVGALRITGEARCTAGAVQVVFTVENVWTSEIGFLGPNYIDRWYGDPDDWYSMVAAPRVALDPDPIPAGASEQFSVAFDAPEGVAGLQLEPMFGDDGSTAGPDGAGVQVRDPCGALVAAQQVGGSPEFTG